MKLGIIGDDRMFRKKDSIRQEESMLKENLMIDQKNLQQVKLLLIKGVFS